MPACSPFPSSAVEFSSSFQQPQPPNLVSDFNASFIQHKWDSDVSHITSGFIYNSPSRNLVLVDQAYGGGFGYSIFNYSNTTSDGLVDNTLVSFDSGTTTNSVYRDYVNSDFPLITADILVTAQATFAGLVERDLVAGLVSSWDILYQGSISVKAYIDTCGRLVGYDYTSPNLRTRVLTMYFNVATTEGQ